jgi:hypothetical protein
MVSVGFTAYFSLSLQKYAYAYNFIRKRVSLSLQQAVEAHKFVRRRDSHIFQTIGSDMAVRLSVLHAGRPFFPRKIPGTHFC